MEVLQRLDHRTSRVAQQRDRETKTTKFLQLGRAIEGEREKREREEERQKKKQFVCDGCARAGMLQFLN